MLTLQEKHVEQGNRRRIEKLFFSGELGFFPGDVYGTEELWTRVAVAMVAQGLGDSHGSSERGQRRVDNGCHGD